MDSISVIEYLNSGYDLQLLLTSASGLNFISIKLGVDIDTSYLLGDVLICFTIFKNNLERHFNVELSV